MARSNFLISILAVAAGSCSTPALAKNSYPSGLYKVLKAAGFRFQDEKDHRTLVSKGPLLVAGKQYQIWDFIWDDRQRVNPDKTPYSHESLIVLEQTKAGQFYVGAYEVGIVTYKICGKAICFTGGESEADRGFGYKPLADKIVFGEKGPPAIAHVNGVDRHFVRRRIPFTVGWNEPDYRTGVWKALFDGGFAGLINSDTRIEPVGSIPGRGKTYGIWRYIWEETPETKAASTEHAAYGLLVFERSQAHVSFLGHYVTDPVPVRVGGRTIKLGKEGGGPSGDAGGDSEIVFAQDGPPAHVLLNGEICTFDPAAHHVGTWRALEQGGFGGITDIDARIFLVGTITAGGKRYEIWSYSWKGRAGNEPLESRKVLVFERGMELTYLGSYNRDDVPFHIEGRTIKFDLPKTGKPKDMLSDDPGPGIEFDDKGPPAQARVNWQTLMLAK